MSGTSAARRCAASLTSWWTAALAAEGVATAAVLAAVVAGRSDAAPAWLLRRCQQLGREEQAHRAAAVVPAVDRGALEVGAEGLLLARAGADVDQLAVGPG